MSAKERSPYIMDNLDVFGVFLLLMVPAFLYMVGWAIYCIYMTIAKWIGV